MKRATRMLGSVLLVGAVVPALCGGQEPPPLHTHLTRNGSGIAYIRTPADYRGLHRPLSALPTYNPASEDWAQVDLRSQDITRLNIASRLPDLRHALFDSKTRWPARLPAGFSPSRIVEAGKNPGLGIRALHQQGITGKGVSIAIVDQALLVNHVEYKDRLRLYEEIHAADETSMHGPAVSSIAVGKTVGVAPGADLYYIGMFHATPAAGARAGREPDLDFTVVARCIDRLLEVNRQLPKERKIRVISMSLGWMPGMPGVKELGEAIERAKREGVFVLSVSVEQTHGLSFGGLGRDALTDPDRLSSYRESFMRGGFLDRPGARPSLWVPMDARATASPTGPSDYVFYAHGGASWTIPYIAGLYALACQVKPSVTPEEFWRKAVDTGDSIQVRTPRRPDPGGAAAKAVDAQVDRLVLRAKQDAQAKDPEVAMAQIASRAGQKRDRISEPEFRAWARDLLLSMRLGDGKTHRMGNVVNPARLIASLRER